MKTTKDLLIAAALTGALGALPVTSFAASHSHGCGHTTEKQRCSGKEGCGSKDGKDRDKAKCQSKGGQDKKKDKGGDKDKNACASCCRAGLVRAPRPIVIRLREGQGSGRHHHRFSCRSGWLM